MDALTELLNLGSWAHDDYELGNQNRRLELHTHPIAEPKGGAEIPGHSEGWAMSYAVD